MIFFNVILNYLKKINYQSMLSMHRLCLCESGIRGRSRARITRRAIAVVPSGLGARSLVARHFSPAAAEAAEQGLAEVVVVEAVEDGVDHGRHVGEGVGEQLEEEHGRRDCVDVEYHAEEEEEVGGQPAEDEVECDEGDELGHLFGLVVVAPLLLVQLALDREHVGGALAARRRRLFACSFEGFLCLAGYVQHGELL